MLHNGLAGVRWLKGRNGALLGVLSRGNNMVTWADILNGSNKVNDEEYQWVNDPTITEDERQWRLFLQLFQKQQLGRGGVTNEEVRRAISDLLHRGNSFALKHRDLLSAQGARGLETSWFRVGAVYGGWVIGSNRSDEE